MRAFVSRDQIAVRVGRRFAGIRRGREYWSERRRKGWKLLYLPFGLRAFYRVAEERSPVVIKHQPDGVHTIPVPRGWSPEQAWEAIVRGDLLIDPQPNWTNVIVKDGRFLMVLHG